MREAHSYKIEQAIPIFGCSIESSSVFDLKRIDNNFPNCKDDQQTHPYGDIAINKNLCLPSCQNTASIDFRVSCNATRQFFFWDIKSGDIAHAEPDEMLQCYVVFNRNLFSIAIIHKRLSAHFIRIWFFFWKIGNYVKLIV